MKPSTPARPRELTPEEKAAQVARFLSQKRESFALSAFAGAIRADGMKHDPKAVAEWSVQAADALMEKLYPIADKGSEKEPEKPVQTDFD